MKQLSSIRHLTKLKRALYTAGLFMFIGSAYVLQAYMPYLTHTMYIHKVMRVPEVVGKHNLFSQISKFMKILFRE